MIEYKIKTTNIHAIVALFQIGLKPFKCRTLLAKYVFQTRELYNIAKCIGLEN